MSEHEVLNQPSTNPDIMDQAADFDRLNSVRQYGAVALATVSLAAAGVVAMVADKFGGAPETAQAHTPNLPSQERYIATGASDICAVRGTARAVQISTPRYHGSNRLRYLNFKVLTVKNCSTKGKRSVKSEIQVKPNPESEYDNNSHSAYFMTTNSKKSISRKYNLVFQKCGQRNFDDNTVLLRGAVTNTWISKNGTRTVGATAYSKPINLCG
ncbi:MAG: hypothetical protein ACR2FM_04490 [Candidatus Saccharimonadales bacterium]